MKIGDYEVVRRLGGGGMAEALLARTPSGREVVLKRPLRVDAELNRRMQDEARIGTRVFHPHLVETLESFVDDGMPILVLGYVPGPTLEELRALGPLPAAAVARVGVHVAEALTAVHGALGDDGHALRAVHRDVTGRNVVINANGDAVLIDLGIARSDDARASQTEAGMIIGTLRYLAPEVIGGAAATSAADMWSLGVLLYEIATAQIAFEGSIIEIAARISTGKLLDSPDGQRLPAPLRDVLARLLRVDVQARCGAAHEASALLRAAEAALGGGRDALLAHAARCPASSPVHELTEAVGNTVTMGSRDGAVRSAEGPPSLASPSLASPPSFASPSFASPRRAAPLPSPPIAAPMASGPSSFYGGGPAPTGGPSSQAGAVALRRPPTTAAPLELDRPLPHAGAAQTVAARTSHYPQHQQPGRVAGMFGSASKALLAIAVLASLYGGYQVWLHAQKTAADLDAVARAREKDLMMNRLLADPMAPSCVGLPEGDRYFMYQNAKGTTVVESDFVAIPKAYRKGAKCVVAARPKR